MMKCIKKMFLHLSVFTIFFLMFLPNVSADRTAVAFNPTGAKCELKSTSTGYCFYSDSNLNSVNYMGWLDTGDKVTIIDSEASISSSDKSLCPGSYVYISQYYNKHEKAYYGYYCDSYLKTDSVLTEEIKNELILAGFPESYWEKLAVMKLAHPNWIFKAINTNLDFNYVVDNENSIGRSLIQVTDDVNDYGYLNTWSGSYNYYTDTFTVFDGSNWYAANYDTIAYYIDPRNFLNDMYIFQFEALAYDDSITDDKYIQAISKIFENDYLNNFKNNFLTAGKTSLTNPIYLASLSYQEVSGMSESITGTNSTLPGIYNFYNIGSNSGDNAILNGLNYASQNNENYLLPWNTYDRAITGGAIWIANNYISIGQNTIYYKKWDIIESGGYYSHQYQQNIQAASSEGKLTFKSYNSIDLLDSSFVFYIPVYNNMPEATSLPSRGNPNNYLSSISINDTKIVGFDGSIVEYDYNLDINNPTLTLSATSVNKNAKIDGLGTFNIEENCTKTITVTAQNGDIKYYDINVTLSGIKIIDATNVISTLNNTDIKNGDKYLSGFVIGSDISIIQEKILNVKNDAIVELKDYKDAEKNSGLISTGDKVKIIVGSDIKEYEVVISGDINGDGEINAIDFNRIKKYMLDDISLTGSYINSADINKDGEVNAIDFNRIKKYMLGDSSVIVQ